MALPPFHPTRPDVEPSAFVRRLEALLTGSVFYVEDGLQDGEEGVYAVRTTGEQLADGFYYLDPEEADPRPGHGPFPAFREAVVKGVEHESRW